MRPKKLLGIAFAFGIVICLVACSGFPSTHLDAAKNNPTNYKQDLKDCTQSYPETPDGVYLKQRISCMNLKGWR